jgi:hypothetical protein
MRNINRSLRDADDSLLPVLAGVWNVNIDTLLDAGEIIDVISKAMIDASRAERVWATLTDLERQALLMLISSGAKMLLPKFERLFGQIRRPAAALIEREHPEANPATTAEGLFYKGLIMQGYEKTDAGPASVVYIPNDMLAILPTHKTAYEKLEDEPEFYDTEPIEVEALEQVTNARNADTSAVDDLTTLLAYLQLHTPALEIDPRMQRLSDYCFAPAERDILLAHMLTPGEERLTFLLGVALSGDLIEVQNGRAMTKRAEARRWLAATRAEQVQMLAEAWRDSQTYREMWHVPGLFPEPGGALDSYDPAVVRQAIAGFLAESVPPQAWWAMDNFIEAVKVSNPDFQRPGGDYESWYIRNEAGDFLEGFESWDAVEGALLEFTVLGPMHWLGLMDVAEDAARLTTYGRTFLNKGAWPTPPEPSDKVVVRDDGTLLVSRKVSRIDRFQVARFTMWSEKAGDPYTYRLNAQGVEQAAKQGINTGHIAAFLSKALDGAALPTGIQRLLDNWRVGPSTSVSMERLLVLRTTAPETMNRIWEMPALRRYLGARLGDMAVIVRADQWEALRDALGEQGIQVDVAQ